MSGVETADQIDANKAGGPHALVSVKAEESSGGTTALGPTFDRLIRSAWGLGIILAITVVVYLPVLDNYFFYDDPILIHAARLVHERGSHEIFGHHFHGHFRPVPTLAFAGIRRLAGEDWANSPIPYHLMSLGLHLVNTALIWRLLTSLLGAGGLAFTATLLFAVAWRASEAVTYLSAFGVEWAAMGTFVAAFGVIRLGKRRSLGWSLLLMAVGMGTALGGGEYGVAGFPILVVLALWRFDGDSWPNRFRRLVLTAATIAPIVGAFVLYELQSRNQGRVGTQFTPGWHMVESMVQNVGNLTFPHLLDEPVLCAILLIAVMAVALSRRGRELMCKSNFWLLLLMAAGSLAVFAPSRMGNYGRFQYLAAAFFMAWLVWLGRELLAAYFPRKPKLVVLGATALVVLNAAFLEVRAHAEAERGDHVQRLVEQVASTVRANPQHEVNCWIVNDLELVRVLLLELEIVRRPQLHRGLPSAFDPEPGQIMVVADYRLRHGFFVRTFVETWEAAERTFLSHRRGAVVR